MRQTEQTKIGTPAYVFDIGKLKERVRAVRAALGGRVRLCYAVKANPFLAEDLIGCVDAFEACSPGEYDLCESLGVPPDEIVLSGVYKAERDVRRAVSRCGDRAVYTAESLSQFQLLCRLAEEFKLRLKVLLRLSSGNQFGMDESTLAEILQRDGLPLSVVGIQYYSGTQKRAEAMGREVRTLCGVALRAKQFAPCLDRIEYGPGLRVDYFLGENTEEASLSALAEALREVPASLEIVLEIGRFIAADCGTYYTGIVDLKRTDGSAYCIVDGGIHQLKYYGQTMAMKIPYTEHLSGRQGPGKTEKWTVCGSLCTTADVLVKDLPLTDAAVGDVLAFRKAGAYSVTEGIALFLSRELPRVYKEESGRRTLLRDFIQTSKINRKGE